MKRSTFLKSLVGAAAIPIVINQVSDSQDEEITKPEYSRFEQTTVNSGTRIDEMLKELIHEDETGQCCIVVKE